MMAHAVCMVSVVDSVVVSSKWKKIACIGVHPQMHFLDLQRLYVFSFRTAGLTTMWHGACGAIAHSCGYSSP